MIHVQVLYRLVRKLNLISAGVKPLVRSSKVRLRYLTEDIHFGDACK